MGMALQPLNSYGSNFAIQPGVDVANPICIEISAFRVEDYFCAMRLDYYHVDAFTDRVFGGNPAGVCPLEGWLPDQIMQSIAMENNLSETAFFVANENHFDLRWFTPKVEVDLCGHATLASAHIIFSKLGYKQDSAGFETRSGLLTATRRENVIELDFPARRAAECGVPEALIGGLGKRPRQVLKSRDYLAVFDSEAEVAALAPNLQKLAELDCLGIIVTAPGQSCDFVSRFFAPRAGVMEDPVTGSSHCTLIPYWAERLGKSRLYARQISVRGGELFCRNLGERVGIGGKAVTYSQTEIEIAESLPSDKIGVSSEDD
jgi:predicted PhzF superfamily epimerase YddE/YHI9